MRVCSTTQHFNFSTIFSVINPVDCPFLLGFVSANQFAILQLHVPLAARPKFFVPPISGQQKWTALINNFSGNFLALKMFIPGTENGRCRSGSKSAESNSEFRNRCTIP